MTSYERRIITANKIMIGFHKQKINQLKTKQSAYSKSHPTHNKLSQLIRNMNAEISKLNADNNRITINQ